MSERKSSSLVEKFRKANKTAYLLHEATHLSSEDSVLEHIQNLYQQYKIEGWLCYTSSLWLLERGKSLQGASFISGDKNNRGTLLSAELHSSKNDTDYSFHLRQDGSGWTIHHYQLHKKEQTNSTKVKLIWQSYFSAVPQDKFPMWKMKYANCWHAVKQGQAPHQIEVNQPLVGLFTGFSKNSK